MIASARLVLFLLAVVLLGAGGLADGAERMARPSWIGKEPLVIVGNWDSMPIFRRRVGNTTTWQEDDYRREHSEQTVVRLKEMGVTMAVIHFYKGFGLEAEKEHIGDARRLAALCKKHGLRVGVYVGSTVAFETFLAECPEAAEWFVPPFLGRPVVYGGQPFRKRVYFMHPGYRAYMKRVLRLAVEELKADLIHFDNTSSQAHGPIFLHPLAVKDFREFLRTKHTPDALRRRLGHAEVSFIEPPVLDQAPAIVSDPLFQEWADFRCHQLSAYYGEMERYIRGLNPEVAVECNPSAGMSGYNTVWAQGVDYPRLLAHMDVVWTEEGNEAGLTPQKILVSKIRTFKTAATCGASVFTYTAGRRGSELQMAEAMAYNRQNLGMVGGPLSACDLPERQRGYIRFYHDHFDKFRAVENLADVAVLHSYASMAYNNGLPWQSTMLVEQSLIQARIPFDIIFDDQLKDLSKYRVLVLADQECLGDEQAGRVRAFVGRGGGLVATEHTSLYTPWRERRPNFALRDLLPLDAPEWRGAREPEALLEGPPARRQAGRGRVSYIPCIQPASAKPPTAAASSRYWKLPRNHEEIVAELAWAAGGRFNLEVRAPLGVTAELTAQKSPHRWLVHLLNYDRGPAAPLPGIEVALRLPPGQDVARLSVVSPDAAAPVPIEPRVAEGRAVFTVPPLKTYSIAVVDFR